MAVKKVTKKSVTKKTSSSKSNSVKKKSVTKKTNSKKNSILESKSKKKPVVENKVNLVKANNYVLILIALVALIAISVVIFPTMTNNSKVAAVVNGQDITQKQLQDEYQIYQNIFRIGDQSVFSKQIMLNLMIDELLLLQEARKQGFSVSDQELDDYIELIISSSSVPLTMEDFQKEFENNNVSFSVVKNLYEKQLLLNKFLDEKIINVINVTEDEIKGLYETRGGSELIDYETIKPSLENALFEQKKETMYRDLLMNLKEESDIQNLLYSDLSDFARCLTNKGAVLYGTFDDAQTIRQKEDLGNSFSYIIYVECKDTVTNLIKKECLNYSVYPVWSINDKTLKGYQNIDYLSDITGCELN